MKARAGKKKVVLELGGNAGVIVENTANIDWAVKRIVTGGFGFAGQSCISVQRVFVHDRIYDEVARRIVERVKALVVGHPLDPKTDVGPMIDTGEVDRIEAWVADAVAEGGRVLTGGTRLARAVYAPTVMEGVPEVSKVCAQEVFAPLIGLYRFTDFAQALAAVNRSNYGLQAGVQGFGYAMFLMTDSAVEYLDKSNGWELGVGPSIVVIDKGMASSLTTTTLKDDVYAIIFDQKGLMAGIGIQGSKITKIHPGK